MTTEVTYIACDGTKFEERWKCEEYEKDLKAKGLMDTLLCFTEDDLSISINNLETIADDSKYVVIKSQEAYEYFSSVLKSLNCAFPDERTVKIANWNISYVFNDENT